MAEPCPIVCYGAYGYTGVHYLDITGEALVFEALSKRHADAKEAGVMLLPGAGFDVVPSDCLAAHVAAQVEGATHLTLGSRNRGGGISHALRWLSGSRPGNGAATG